MKRQIFFLILLILLAIPTFSRMSQQGLFSMQDFPYFRVVQYSTCLRDVQIPCRWAPDAGLGYGEPVFNFYSHTPFFLAASLVTLGLSAVSSLKILFAFSLLGSAISMYLLSKQVWKNNASAMVSAILYLYAPYRAVNVWVRGALPEAFAFVLFPLILLCFEKYIQSRKPVWILSFSLCVAVLILTHNLSVLLFAPVLLFWIIARLFATKFFKLSIVILCAILASILLCAFYILPVVFEANLVNLQTTTLGYFDFRAHFITVPQIFLSRFWGYGGSTWGNEDGLSLSIGQVQWIVGLVTVVIAISRLLRRKKENNEALTILLVSIGFGYLLFTHNKSAFIWEAFSPVMKYIQFPWRFFGVSLFLLSLGSGYLCTVFRNQKYYVMVACIALAITLNYSFFKEDIWYQTSDALMQDRESWIEQSSASLGDYWPIYGPIPRTHRLSAFPDVMSIAKTNASETFEINLQQKDILEFPISYFPGWEASLNGNPVLVKPSTAGLVSVEVSEGKHNLTFTFVNSFVRTIGNTISLISFICISAFFILLRKKNINKL